MNSFTDRNERDSYRISLEREQEIYENCVDVHNLPAIFHYWSNQHLRPKLFRFGLDGLNSLFKNHLAERYDKVQNRQRRFVSLGAGNCDLEIEISLDLCAGQRTDFVIECVDLNAAMLERGRVAAAKAGVASQLTFIQGDLNTWNPASEYDAAIANQSLHHVVDLEDLFHQLKRSLLPEGTFIISDMIGRNGHQRWPEALAIVREFWQMLPPSYRINRKLGCYEEVYEDWDCSVEGFEGIRAQDILPLLVERFQFQLFVPFGNVIDPFVDRAFGPNFDAGAQWDRAFIDSVHHRDEQEIASGRLKPTHMVAVVGKRSAAQPIFPERLAPHVCVRSAYPVDDAPGNGGGGHYRWHSWPHSPQRELEIVCEKLGQAGPQIKKRTAWALRVEREVKEAREWAWRLEKDLHERTEWAWRLDKELEERTEWALQLQRELEDHKRSVKRLEGQLHSYLHNPFRFALRLAIGVLNRLNRVFASNRKCAANSFPDRSTPHGARQRPARR